MKLKSLAAALPLMLLLALAFAVKFYKTRRKSKTHEHLANN